MSGQKILAGKSISNYPFLCCVDAWQLNKPRDGLFAILAFKKTMKFSFSARALQVIRAGYL
jgi:hypothetical protein